MKRIVHILVLACLMAACTSPVETRHGASLPTDDMHPRLAAIDTLMWQQPDSALAVLLDFAGSPLADSLDAFDGHYCQMLVSELLYKNDCEQTNRTELLRAVDYFDSLCISGDVPWRVSTHDVVFLDARAHYINGVGFYEQDSVVEACAEYLKTLEIMEERFEEKDLVKNKAKFMAYTYNRLGDMFSEQFMMEVAIKCYDCALSYCLIEPTSSYGISKALGHIALQYSMLKDDSQAKLYYEQALEQMPDVDNVTYRDIQSHIALCNYDLGLGWEQPIEALHQLYDKDVTESEGAIYALFIGSIYAEEHYYDSALSYLEPLFEEYGEIEAAKYLRVIYDSLGYHEKGNACRRFLADHYPSEGENKALVSKLNDLFQQYLNQKQERQPEQEIREVVIKIMKWIIPAFLFFAFVIIIAVRNRHKRKIMAQQQLHQTQQAALSGRLKRSNQEVRELKGQIRRQNDLAAKTEVASSFTEEPVCRLIMERVKEGQFKSKVDCSAYKDYALDKQQMLELCLAADRHFGNFTIRLKENYPALTQGDLDYCCLYLLGITDADVAALMQRDYSTIVARNNKMRKVLGSKCKLSVTLLSFAASL
ncbi:MAG: hypothetical protein MJZ94_04725 [Bacteroidales bacterium]|nr:hypothetical protein [Bacteroidales bacterium]